MAARLAAGMQWIVDALCGGCLFRSAIRPRPGGLACPPQRLRRGGRGWAFGRARGRRGNRPPQPRRLSVTLGEDSPISSEASSQQACEPAHLGQTLPMGASVCATQRGQRAPRRWRRRSVSAIAPRGLPHPPSRGRVQPGCVEPRQEPALDGAGFCSVTRPYSYRRRLCPWVLRLCKRFASTIREISPRLGPTHRKRKGLCVLIFVHGTARRALALPVVDV